MFKFTYDPEVDAAYLYLQDENRKIPKIKGSPPIRTKDVGRGIYLDFDRDGKFVGVEILDASYNLLPELIQLGVSPDPWFTLSEAGEQSGLQADSLRSLIHNGRLKGEKRGRDWMVSGSALFKYLDAREARGRPPKLRRPRKKANR